MSRNEKTSTRVAKIAAKVLALKFAPPGLNSFVQVVYARNGKVRIYDPDITWADIRALAASALTQAADKRDDQGFDPREGGKVGREFIPKSAQARKAMRGELGATIKGKRPSSWPPAAKPVRRSP